MQLLEIVKKFLQPRLIKGSPLILGYSGGGDSKALLSLLLDCKREMDFELVIAHVDHGWREESRNEAQLIALEAKRLSLPFHLLSCTPPKTGNYEDFYRDKRREFFYALHQKIGAQALLLAHHQDDLVETVFKRILEGSSLSHLSGIEEESSFRSMNIWRPLLKVPKKELLRYLEERKTPFFHDYTNEDEKYLRARLRKKIIPKLEKEFGKTIAQNLLYFAKQGNEISQYLDTKIQSYEAKITEGPLGICLDLSDLAIEKVELFHLLQKLSKEKGYSLSRKNKERIFHSLVEGTKFSLNLLGKKLVVERKKVFFTEDFPKWPSSLVIDKEGRYEVFGWNISVKQQDPSRKVSKGWKSLWVKESTLILPKGEYRLALSPEGEYFKGKRLKKRWQEEKIPDFLRQHLPLVFNGQEVVGDFLLSHPVTIEGSPSIVWEITLSK